MHKYSIHTYVGTVYRTTPHMYIGTVYRTYTIHAWCFVMPNAIVIIAITCIASCQDNPLGTRLKPGDVQSLGFVAPNKTDVLTLKVRLQNVF